MLRELLAKLAQGAKGPIADKLGQVWPSAPSDEPQNAANAELNGPLEAATMDIGARWLAIARKNPDPKTVKDRFTDWALEDPQFKVQLFRFIDAYPKLKGDGELVYRVLCEYLQAPGVRAPAGVTRLLGLGQYAKGRVDGEIAKGVEDMGRRYMAGSTPAEALSHVAKRWKQGVAFSADLLGEACVSEAEALDYRERYTQMMRKLADSAGSFPANPLLETDHLGPIPRCNISIKLSSLVAKYSPVDPEGSADRCVEELRPLLEEAKERNVFINFDVEQAALKELNLRVFMRCVEEIDFPAGLAMQAYLKSGVEDAERVIRWAKANNKQVTVRLVKGAYWDQEVILAQEQGWPCPVWTQKWESDACFEAMAQRFVDAIPRSANEAGVKLALGSHNIRSIAAVVAMVEAAGLPSSALELQMLYGMAHGPKMAAKEAGLRLREYVPVGELIPGMAYLVRRLLENTSNESWLLKGMDPKATTASLLAKPKRGGKPPIANQRANPFSHLPKGAEFDNEPLRDFSQPACWKRYSRAVEQAALPEAPPDVDRAQCEGMVDKANGAFQRWNGRPVQERAAMLSAAADAMAKRRDELSALLVLEAGKTWADADADTCEAIDFLRYYAALAPGLCSPKRLTHFLGETHHTHYRGRGVAAAIAPWNFPLAIFAGLAVAPLVMGNPVVAKPAEQTPRIAAQLCEFLWEAGVPRDVLHLAAGAGETVGAALVEHPAVATIGFTGSRDVGLSIWRAAGVTAPGQPSLKRVICEMGGKNPIIVDASADLDEAVLGVRHSAFGFSGQKCSACSRVYVHERVADEFQRRLVESTKALAVGDPRQPGTDMGPVIDEDAKSRILEAIQAGKADAQLLLGSGECLGETLGKPLIGPHIFATQKPTIPLLQAEIFGPVVTLLRVANFDQALGLANQSAYHLTAALYSRTPSHLERARRELLAGNLYLNRGCTGAIVGRHPFGGFGMSGGGTKAGGLDYLTQFGDPVAVTENTVRRGFSPDLPS